MKIELPWPDRALNPNARAHFMVKARAAKAYRVAAGWAAKAALASGEPEIPQEGKIRVGVVFVPPNNRRRLDLDNALASIKAGLDGLADVLKVNDVRFALTIEMGEPDPEKAGRVEITV